MVPVEIIKHIYVGNDDSYNKVKDNENFFVIRCCKFGDSGHKDILGYKTQAAPDGEHKYWARKGRVLALNLLDLDDPNFEPKSAFVKAFDTAKDELIKGHNVLFACNSGHSRGPTTALMFLRTIGEMPSPFIQSEKIYRTLYPAYSPGAGIRTFARREWGNLKDLEIKNG